METMTYITAMMLVLFLFIARHYFMTRWLDRENESHMMVMAAHGAVGRMAFSVVLVLVGLLYAMGKASIALDISLMAAFIAILGVTFGRLVVFRRRINR